MTLQLSSGDSKLASVVTAALVISTASFFAVTAFLYWEHSRQRELLAVSIRTSGWTAYQAQLELIKTLSALRIFVISPSMAAQEEVILRVEILYSRLPVLYESEESQLLTEMPLHLPSIKEYENVINDFLEKDAKNREEPIPAERAEALLNELQPLTAVLQNILQTSVAYNKEVYDRERELARSPAAVPLALMFISVTSLFVFVRLQAMRDRQRLRAVEQARAEASQMQESLQALIRAIPALVIVFDPRSNTVSFANTQAQLLIGNVTPTSPEWHRFIESVQEAIRSNHAGDLDVKLSFQHADGAITALVGHCQPVKWEGYEQYLVALADSTQLRDAQLQVMQAAKLATLGEMASAIAHELNQPLTVIWIAAANAKRLLMVGDVSELDAKLTRIIDQVDRARRITDQVRRYGRKPSSPEPFLLRRTIDLAIGFVAEQYSMSGIRLVIDIDLPFNLQVAGDQTLFEQVIVNLLINARDAYEEKRAGFAQHTVEVRAEVKCGRALMYIRDHAGGIDENVLPRVFDPFMTTKSPKHGTGLGLSISRKVVQSMGGEIQASNVTDGALFTISLPIYYANRNLTATVLSTEVQQ